MKNIGGKSLFQFVLLATIIAIFGYSIVDNLYGPFSTDKGFPLALVWETKLNDNVKQVLVSDSGHILVRLEYSVNSLSLETGKLLWKYRTDDPIYSIAIHKNAIYVIGKNTVFTLDEETGNLVWQRVSQIGLPLNGEIRYVDDQTLAAVDYSDVYMLKSQTGESITPNFNVGRGMTDTCTYLDKFYTFNRDINAYDLTTGKFLWDDLINDYPSNTVCESGIAYFSENRSTLFAYDLEKRTVLWTLTLPLSDTGIFDIYNTENFLFVDGIDNFFIIDKGKGEVTHSIPSAGYTTSKTIIGDNLFVFYMHSTAIHSYNLHSWENTGLLQYSLTTILGSRVDRFLGDGNQLILWKGKRLSLYQ